MKKLLKKIGYGLLGLLILLLVIGFLLPGQRHIEATVEIDAPMQLVFDQVNDLRNWEKWSPWQAMDPVMEISYSNPPAGKGAFMVWNSTEKRIGEGKMTLAEVVPNDRIMAALELKNRHNAVTQFSFLENKKHIEVKWGMTYEIGGNPIKRYAGLFQAGSLRNTFSSGLKRMKHNLENR